MSFTNLLLYKKVPEINLQLQIEYHKNRNYTEDYYIYTLNSIKLIRNAMDLLKNDRDKLTDEVINEIRYKLREDNVIQLENTYLYKKYQKMEKKLEDIFNN